MTRFLIAAFLLAGSGCLGLENMRAKKTEYSATQPHMTSTVHTLLQSLDQDQRDRIQFSFTDAERFDWNFVPQERNGLPLRAMNDPQRTLVRDLLRVALSENGAAKVDNILLIEGILDEIESKGRPDRQGRRDPTNYYLTVFGEPSDKEPWGWRFEGHHLSLNFSTVSGFSSGTPAFYGANPAEIPPGHGEHSGLRTLPDEEDLGRRLIDSFDQKQKARAIVSETAPREILTGTAREAFLKGPSGLAFAEMTADQREILRQIVATYVDNLNREMAADLWGRIAERGWEQVYFAWAGETEKGRGHYYRIQGPSFLIEYDNVQNDANHVHSVLRDLKNDWGIDLLRQHHEQHDHR